MTIRLSAADIDPRYNTALEWDDLWKASRDNPKWVMTTEKMFDEMLTALPPRIQREGSFLVGEPYSTCPVTNYPTYSCFIIQGFKTYHKHVTLREFLILHGEQP